MSSPKKKILIISMTGGFGHVRAGQALLDYAKESLPDVVAEHIDLADMNPLFKKAFAALYDTASKKLPFVWGAIYKLLDVRFVSLVVKKLGGMNYLTSRKIQNYIYQKNPDGIIFTNVIPLPLFNANFRKKFANISMGVVVTDYHGHPYYNFPWLNYYFVPTTEVKSDLEAIGVPAEKIVVTGIPINPKFYVVQDISVLKVKYGLNNSLPVVLFITSFKISKKELLETVGHLLALEPRINLIVIANGNTVFYDIIKGEFKSEPRLLLINWTDVVEEYMKLCDVVISKAGGLTVSECLALRKPLIMVRPILGQEEHNAQYVEKNHWGVHVKNVEEITEVLPGLLESSKNNELPAGPIQNPSEKIFTYFE